MKLKKNKDQPGLYNCDNPKEIKLEKNIESQISINPIMKKKNKKKNWLLEYNPKPVVDSYHTMR